ncbi:MbnP family protein [Aquimarina latercula]|uniref:MbnP family protein n=1 Tax=Aquimarina latercula TaxID=987 RepID=UPI0004256CBB|nr:MbnP family protein [Aquimarina latercula]
MKKLTLIILALITILSCKDDDPNVVDVDNTPKFGALDIDFINKVGTELLILNTESYNNQSNENYTVSELKYIISNIVLIKENGDEFIYPVADSYFLINEEVSSSKQISLSNIDVGEYTKIKFGVGVDQSNYPLNGVANFIPTAEEEGMLWSWSAGYKFVKFEGSFTPQGGTASDFLLHIGSHGEVLDNYKEITLNISNTITIEDQVTSNLSIDTDVSKIFDSTNTHSLQQKSDVQVDPINAPILAENISTMFTINSSN